MRSHRGDLRLSNPDWNEYELLGGLRPFRFRSPCLKPGSFNLDARSAMINTEAGLYIESPELAQQVAAFINEGVDPDNAFRVELDADGKLVWSNQDDGVPMRYDTEPMSTLTQRMQAAFIRMLPVAGQL